MNLKFAGLQILTVYDVIYWKLAFWRAYMLMNKRLSKSTLFESKYANTKGAA
jgi:hypothetical protein